jgi:hypothetical protein
MGFCYCRIGGDGMESFSIHIDDASGNNFLKLPRLKELDLRDNRLSSLTHLVFLAHLQALQNVKFQSKDGGQANPVCHVDGYLDTVSMVRGTTRSNKCLKILNYIENIRHQRLVMLHITNYD